MRNFLAGLAACAVMLCAGYGLASRNSSGTMSSANGPYIPGTVINSAQVNARFADIENELTDSLSRSGKGGMSAPIREADGTVGAPSFSFTNESGSGLYRIGANDFGFAVSGVKKHEWTNTGESITGTLALSDLFTQTLAGSASTLAHTIFQPSLTNGNFLQLRLGRTSSANDYGAIGFIPNATAALSTICLGINGGSPSAFCVDGNNKTAVAGALAVTGATTLSGGISGSVAVTGALTTTTGATIGSSGTATSQINYGSCTCNGSTPSSCTATVAALAKCVASVAGGAAVASGLSLSGTTLTVFCPNTNTSAVNFICFTP